MAAHTTTERWKKHVRLIQRRLDGIRDFSTRLRAIAEGWVGRPYLANSLVGGPNVPEQLVVNLEAFDCVTFIESVLALARSHSFAGFLEELIHLRYRNGQIDWRSRLHYFYDWMIWNQRRGVIRIRSRGTGSRLITARPGFIADLPRREVRFHVVPKRNLNQARHRMADGSIVAFASVRAKLDFFHTGLIFGGQALWLYHASRSRGKVVAEPLEKFLARNRMRGLAFAIPIDPGGGR